jgi:hypothetical protein
MMYDAQRLLSEIDAHRWWILGGFAVAMIFQWVWLIECIRVAKRDRAYSMPLFCTFFWFAHDTGCVARFHDWFVTYDHWYLKCFWFGLLTAAALEVAFFAQVIRYGREELAPELSPRLFVLGLVVVQIAASTTWELLKSFGGDPLYQASPALTMVSYPLLGAALLLRRGSSLGQSVLMWSSFTGMSLFWFVTAGIFYGEPFRSWQYLGAGAVAVLGGSAMTYQLSGRSTLLRRDRAVTRSTPDSAAPAHA